MTNKEIYSNRIVRKVIRAVKHGTAREVQEIIESAFIQVYTEGYKAEKGVDHEEAK